MSALLCLLTAASLQAAAQNGVLVAYDSGVDAYTEVLAGIREHLPVAAAGIVDLHGPAGIAGLDRAIAATNTRLVIAVGAQALAEVQSRRAGVPVLSVLVLHGPESGSPAGHLDLDVSLAAQLSAMHSLLPRAARVGIVRNPARSRYTAEALESRARKEGFTAVLAECDRPGQLLKALASLKGKVDFVLCFPDPDLFNAATIKPLILLSLEERLPVVGYSPAFVRAGAAAGIYPDYRETGRQAADLALRMLRGEERLPDENPSKVRVAVNERVARLLGLQFAAAPFPVEVFR